LRQIFEKIQDSPPAYVSEKQHERIELDAEIKNVTRYLAKLNKDLSAYKKEVINVLQGNSPFTAEILNQLISDTDASLAKQTAEYERLRSELDEIDARYEKAKAEHKQIRTWCEIFHDSDLDTQRMVVSSIISEVRLWKGYRMEIDLNLSVKDFADGMTFDSEKINISVGE